MSYLTYKSGFPLAVPLWPERRLSEPARREIYPIYDPLSNKNILLYFFYKNIFVIDGAVKRAVIKINFRNII